MHFTLACSKTVDLNISCSSFCCHISVITTTVVPDWPVDTGMESANNKVMVGVAYPSQASFQNGILPKNENLLLIQPSH